MDLALDQSLVTAPADIHTMCRRTLTTIMTKEFLRSQEEHISEEIHVLFAKLDRASEEDLSVDFDLEIIRFAIDVIFRVTLSNHIHAQNGKNEELVNSVKGVLEGVYR